jgi:hypothetical protein
VKAIVRTLAAGRPRLGESASDGLLGAVEIRARFSEKRSSAKHGAGRGVDRSVGGVGFGACFHAGACVRSGRSRRSDAWQCASRRRPERARPGR